MAMHVRCLWVNSIFEFIPVCANVSTFVHLRRGEQNNVIECGKMKGKDWAFSRPEEGNEMERYR